MTSLPAITFSSHPNVLDMQDTVLGSTMLLPSTKDQVLSVIQTMAEGQVPHRSSALQMIFQRMLAEKKSPAPSTIPIPALPSTPSSRPSVQCTNCSGQFRLSQLVERRAAGRLRHKSRLLCCPQPICQRTQFRCTSCGVTVSVTRGTTSLSCTNCHSTFR